MKYSVQSILWPTQSKNKICRPTLSCAGKFLITLLYSLQRKVILGMVIAFSEKLEGISQQERSEENKEKVGERVERKNGKEKRVGKKMKLGFQAC